MNPPARPRLMHITLISGLLILGLAALVFGVVFYNRPLAQQRPDTSRTVQMDSTGAPLHDGLAGSKHRVMPLQKAVQIATERFRGRLISARLTAPRPRERAQGVAVVHELRLLTRDRNVLLIRLDAQTGAFLEVAGRGLSQARRNKDDTE